MVLLLYFYHPPQYYALYYKIFVIMAKVEYVCIYIYVYFVMIYKVQKKNLRIKWCKNLIIGIICIYVKGILYPISLRD